MSLALQLSHLVLKLPAKRPVGNLVLGSVILRMRVRNFHPLLKHLIFKDRRDLDRPALLELLQLDAVQLEHLGKDLVDVVLLLILGPILWILDDKRERLLKLRRPDLSRLVDHFLDVDLEVKLALDSLLRDA